VRTNRFTVTVKLIVFMADTVKGICGVMELIGFLMAQTLINEQVNMSVILLNLPIIEGKITSVLQLSEQHC